MLGDSRHAFSRSWMWAVEHRGIYRFSGNACRKPPGAWLESFAVSAAQSLSLSMLPEQRRDSSTRSGSSSRLSNLHPSVKAPFHPLAGISYSSVLYNRSRRHDHISCLSLWEIIPSWWTYRVPCSLPTAEASTRPWIRCGEIHTFVSHCFLEVWANIISYGYHISFEPCLALSTAMRQARVLESLWGPWGLSHTFHFSRRLCFPLLGSSSLLQMSSTT